MSSLTIYSEDAPDQGRTLRDAGEIGRELAAIGVRFERWRAQAPLAPGAAPEDVLAAYREQIDRLVAERGYRSVDVVSLDPSHPERAALRAKFWPSIRMPTTRCVSSSPAAACSCCTPKAACTRRCASRTI